MSATVRTQPTCNPDMAVVGETVERLNALGAYLRYQSGDPTGGKRLPLSGWIDEWDLAFPDRAPLSGLFAALARDGFGGNKRALSASILLRYGWSSGFHVGLWLTTGCVAAGVQMKLRFSSNAVLTEIAIRDCARVFPPHERDPADMRSLLVRELAGRAAPIVEAHHRWSGFSRGQDQFAGRICGAVLLVGFAAIMAIESVQRLTQPVAIQFDQALIVAVVGLVVNGGSVLLLGHGHDPHHDHKQPYGHDDDDHDHHHEAHDHDHDHPHEKDAHHHHHDHNLRAAYLHVLADAMTSVLAIGALLAGKFAGWSWLDPAMGIVGAGLVMHWSWGLLRESGGVLLDRQAPAGMLEDVRRAVESDGARVTDLHLWSIGPGIRAAEMVIAAGKPLAPGAYRVRLPRSANIVHAVIEVNEVEKA